MLVLPELKQNPPFLGAEMPSCLWRRRGKSSRHQVTGRDTLLLREDENKTPLAPRKGQESPPEPSQLLLGKEGAGMLRKAPHDPVARAEAAPAGRGTAPPSPRMHRHATGDSSLPGREESAEQGDPSVPQVKQDHASLLSRLKAPAGLPGGT